MLDEVREGPQDISIDKRADLVNACVEQALKEHPRRVRRKIHGRAVLHSGPRIAQPQEDDMAKGQQRQPKEKKKPKAEGEQAGVRLQVPYGGGGGNSAPTLGQKK